MIDSLKGLLIEQVKDLYHAEKQLLHAVPRWSVAVTSQQLKEPLERHGDETRDQVTRLERVFALIDEHPAERKCRAMLGMISETDELLRECVNAEARDAAVIGSMQRIQHYEMAGYGAARTYARMLGFEEAARLLQQTLDEEGHMDHELSELATSTINRMAVPS